MVSALGANEGARIDTWKQINRRAPSWDSLPLLTLNSSLALLSFHRSKIYSRRPEVFKEKKPTAAASEKGPTGSDSDSYDSDGLPPLPPNPNKPKGYYTRRDSDSESSTTSD